eukprot:185443_1
MAQPLASNESDPALTSNDPPQSTINTEFTGFLKYKPPFDEPTLELKYEITYSLSEIIDTFKSMVFNDHQRLPESLRDSVKFAKRKCTFSETSKLSTDEFKGNKNGNLCEVLKFDVTVLPLLPGFDPKEYEQKLKQKEEEEKKKSEAEKVSKSGWGSWASLESWQEWGSSMLDTEAWSASINAWIKYFNMSMDATEIWKIDWIQHKATSFVQNVTMSWTVGVYEYAEMEQLMHITSTEKDKEESNEPDENKTDKENDGKVKVVFIKKLYVHPIVPMPQYALDLLRDQYRKDSDTQVQLINNLCQKPLAFDTNDTLQQLDDV